MQGRWILKMDEMKRDNKDGWKKEGRKIRKDYSNEDGWNEEG